MPLLLRTVAFHFTQRKPASFQRLSRSYTMWPLVNLLTLAPTSLPSTQPVPATLTGLLLASITWVLQVCCYLGPRHSAFPLPGKLFLQIPMWLIPLPSRHLSKVWPPLVNCNPPPLSRNPYHTYLAPFFHSTHQLIHCIIYLCCLLAISLCLKG